MNARVCRALIGFLTALAILLGVAAARFARVPLCAACSISAAAAIALTLQLYLPAYLRHIVRKRATMDAPPHYAVRHLRDEAELQAMWEINRELYGSGALDLEAYLQWWRTYPHAVHGLFNDGRLAGGVTVWPLRANAFRRLVRGEWALCADDIFSIGESTRCRHWYMSGIAVLPEYRSPEALRYLMLRTLSACMEAGKERVSHHICGVAYSAAGERLLQRYGLTRSSATTDEGFPVYATRNAGPLLLIRMMLGAFRYKRRSMRGKMPDVVAAHVP